MIKIGKAKILYGAGIMGKQAFEYYTKNDSSAVYCFADTFKGGEGKEYCGLSVVSFKKFLEIHEGYEVVICIWDLFGIVREFEKNGVYDFEIFSDDIIRREKFPWSNAFYDSLKPLDKPPNSHKNQKKILYGAGIIGKQAFPLYGNDQVHAFSDKNKAGSEYLGKTVLHPSILSKLQEEYDIIVCVKNYDAVAEYLRSKGVFRFRKFLLLSKSRKEEIDFALSDGLENFLNENTTADVKIINELKNIDFLENPELIIDYYFKYFAFSRKGITVKPIKNRAITRLIEENKVYGYLNEMLIYADRCGMFWYEAPSVFHGLYEYYNERRPVTVKWNSLIEPTDMTRKYIHENYKDCLIFVVGAYLNYVRSFYSENDFLAAKGKLGRNLTVFPIHTIPSFTADYDMKEFASIILKEAKNFDSVTICVYFHDYGCGNCNSLVNSMKSAGAKIVSTGFHTDPSFVRRLKTIILLSDAILTNSVGSHINHALSLNKPVKLINQRIKAHSITEGNNENKKFYEKYDLKEKTVLLKNKDYCITEEQRQIYEPITGFSIKKSPEEMASIFDLSKLVIQNAAYSRKNYIHGIRRTYIELQTAKSSEEKLLFKLMEKALPKDYSEHIRRNSHKYV